MSRWALSIAMMFGMIGLAAAQAPSVQPPQPQLAYPSEIKAERWVWENTRNGKVADLGEHCKEQKDLATQEDLDPRDSNDARWRDPCRAISATFLEQVLTQEPWRSGLPFRGLRIIGAWVSEPLDVAAARIPVEVRLERSRFESKVSFARARFDGLLVLDGSTFADKLDADSLQAGGNLYLRAGVAVRGGPLVLRGAKIADDLDMSNSTFENGIEAHRLHVEGGLFLRGWETPHGAVVRGELNLVRAKIAGELHMIGSIFENGISASSLEVGGSLLLGDKAAVRGGPLVLRGAKIAGDLDMSSSTFEEGISASSLEVGRNLLLRDTIFKQTSEITSAQIKGELGLGGAELLGLDLSGTTIGALRLGDSKSPPPTWTAKAEQPSHLILRGTRTKVLLDRLDASESCPYEDAWPDRLDLQGFVYEQLGADSGPGRDMREREDCWYKKWLERDPHFNPRSYQQLANVLQEMGDSGRADAVLYAARERERIEASARGDYLKATWLSLQKMLIGYGIGSERIFFLVICFTLIGMFVLWWSPPARAKGPAWMLGASFDHLLPIVSLNKEFADFFDDPKRERLRGWQVGYFAFHALFGILLGSLVGTALARLMQTG